jgi:hypothetical protein
MGFLRRTRGEPAVPAWAGSLDPGQFGAFISAVTAALERRGLQHTVGDGFVQLDGAHDRRVLGLSELAQSCRALPPERWPDNVEAHFAALLDEPPAARVPAGAQTLAALRVDLRPRPDAPANETGISRPVADGLVAVLVLVGDGTVADVDPGDADAWGQPGDALWERARANTRAGVELQRIEHELPGGMHVTVSRSESPFAAVGALWPEDSVGALGPAGALVAVPNRHLLVVHAIRHLGVIEGMRHLVPLVARRYSEGPGSISDQLYWSCDGALTRVGATLDGEWVSVTPPAPLLTALNGLPAPGVQPREA